MWAQFKTALAARFGEVTDGQHALPLLSKTMQHRHENIQLFEERLLAIAEDAYAGMYVNCTAAIERPLI
jgi:hypothetical protein